MGGINLGADQSDGTHGEGPALDLGIVSRNESCICLR